MVNDSPIGLARFCSLRSWLSQWSIDHANGDGIRAARDVGVPSLVIVNGADEICTPGYARELFDALGHEDKTMVADRRCQPLLHRPRPDPQGPGIDGDLRDLAVRPRTELT